MLISDAANSEADEGEAALGSIGNLTAPREVLFPQLGRQDSGSWIVDGG